MRILTRISAINVLLLCLVGGFSVRLPIGKFEWGVVAPWAAALVVFSFVFYRSNRAEFQSFASETLSVIERRQNLPFIAIAWVAAFSFFAHWARYLHFSATYYDMGFLHQALMHPLSGDHGLMANLSPKESYLVDHFAPSLLLLSPFIALFKSDVLVFFVQSVLVFLPILFLVRALPKEMSENRIFLVVCLLSSIALRSAAIWDFREDVLGYVFLFWALFSLDRKKQTQYIVALVGFLLSKEHLWIVAFGLAFLAYFEFKEKRLAAITAVFAFAWGVFLFSFLIPHLQAGLNLAAVNNIVSRYGEFGSSASEIIRNILIHPTNWLKIFEKAFLNRESVRYLVMLLLPFAAALYFKPRYALAIAPGILMNLASGVSAQRSLGFHYDIAFLPFLAFGLFQVLRDRKLAGAQRWFFIAFALVASGRWPAYTLIEKWPSQSDFSDTRFLSEMNCDQATAGGISVLAHLTRCDRIHAFYSPKDCVFNKATLEALASNDPSRRVGRNFLFARQIVVSSSDPCSAEFEKTLIASEFVAKAQSSSGRLKLYESSQSLGDFFKLRGSL